MSGNSFFDSVINGASRATDTVRYAANSFRDSLSASDGSQDQHSGSNDDKKLSDQELELLEGSQSEIDSKDYNESILSGDLNWKTCFRNPRQGSLIKVIKNQKIDKKFVEKYVSSKVLPELLALALSTYVDSDSSPYGEENADKQAIASKPPLYVLFRLYFSHPDAIEIAESLSRKEASVRAAFISTFFDDFKGITLSKTKEMYERENKMPSFAYLIKQSFKELIIREPAKGKILTDLFKGFGQN